MSRSAGRSTSSSERVGLLSVALIGSLFAMARPSGAAEARWPDTDLGRLEAMVELQTLNADLLSHSSATLTLDRWCAQHKLATEPRIVADRSGSVAKAPDEEVRRRLGANAGETIGYRHVRLRCGERVLSEADNWYLPSKLTPEMNRQLETSDTPFGRVVQPLDFRRQVLGARLLWTPVGPDAKRARPMTKAAQRLSTLTIPAEVLEHRAVLTRSDGSPFSYVVETYTGAVLDFPPTISTR